MANLKLDSDHDIIIGRGTTRCEGDEFIAQAVKSRLLFILGTWELNTRLGIPWLTEVLTKDSDSDLFQSIIRNAIINTPGVAQVVNLSLNKDRISRKLNISFTATTINKSQITQEI